MLLGKIVMLPIPGRDPPPTSDDPSTTTTTDPLSTTTDPTTTMNPFLNETTPNPNVFNSSKILDQLLLHF